GRADRVNDAETRARSNSSWCREGPRISLSIGLLAPRFHELDRTHPILIRRGGRRPWAGCQEIDHRLVVDDELPAFDGVMQSRDRRQPPFDLVAPRLIKQLDAAPSPLLS